MSRTRKRTVREIFKSKKYYTVACPRHGRCSWCDSNRQHNKIKTEQNVEQDVQDYDRDLFEY